MIEQLEITAKRREYRTDKQDNILVFDVVMTVNGIKYYNIEFYIAQDDFISNFNQLWERIGNELLYEMKKNNKKNDLS